MELNRVNDADTVEDIACWFKQEAVELAAGMTHMDGKVITEEMLYQSKAIKILEEVSWFIATQGSPQASHPSIPQEFDTGDTSSIQTQNTTATKVKKTPASSCRCLGHGGK